MLQHENTLDPTSFERASGLDTRMPYHEAYFTTSDGIRLFQRRWLPTRTLWQWWSSCMGFEHSGRYADLAEGWPRMALPSADLRGHGKSDGPRAMVYSFDEYLRDVETLLRRAGERSPANRSFCLDTAWAA